MVDENFRFARGCYGHLAGVLGVAVTEALIARGLLETASETRYALTESGRAWFHALGVDVAAIKPTAKGLARRCLDGTERRPHLGGPLAVCLLERMVALGWLERPGATRILRITPAGRQALADHFGPIPTAPVDDRSAGIQSLRTYTNSR